MPVGRRTGARRFLSFSAQLWKSRHGKVEAPTTNSTTAWASVCVVATGVDSKVLSREREVQKPVVGLKLRAIMAAPRARGARARAVSVATTNSSVQRMKEEADT